jgi:hypothetical protein
MGVVAGMKWPAAVVEDAALTRVVAVVEGDATVVVVAAARPVVVGLDVELVEHPASVSPAAPATITRPIFMPLRSFPAPRSANPSTQLGVSRGNRCCEDLRESSVIARTQRRTAGLLRRFWLRT